MHIRKKNYPIRSQNFYGSNIFYQPLPKYPMPCEIFIWFSRVPECVHTNRRTFNTTLKSLIINHELSLKMKIKKKTGINSLTEKGIK